MKYENYSVLMSVYYKEEPLHLREAIDSIFNQTIPPYDFILVCDGPLTDDLNLEIKDQTQKHNEINVVRLEKNMGLGNALNRGIKYCKCDLIARMDSDDISRPERSERQLELFQKYPETSICSGFVEEFLNSRNSVIAQRVIPETNREIIHFSKRRNPFNHPCVMYRKRAVNEAGGYKDLYLLEDYFLWVRMLQKGFVGYNIQEPLLWMRSGPELYKRRSGFKYCLSQEALFRYMYKTNYITLFQYIQNVIIRDISSILPNCIRGYMFKNALRKMA